MQMELGDKELERVVGHLIGRVQGAGAFRALRGSSRGIKYEEFVRVLRTASNTQVVDPMTFMLLKLDKAVQ